MTALPLTVNQPLGNSGLSLPPIVFGTSCLGNLYRALPWETKRGIMANYVANVAPPVVLDTAGKYGAGLALEVIARGVRDLGIDPDQIVISNKLGWKRIPMRGSEPTFEPGAWADLEYDAEQSISYGGIRECWEQGCELLGGLRPRILSVHDPDEYLSAASSPADRERRVDDIIGAYTALHELKAKGEADAVGVGSKDWQIIRELAEKVQLDWVMLACSLTVMTHPPELLSFMADLHRRGIAMINSAVFHAGFLTGGSYFDYRLVDPANAADRHLFDWRERFVALCDQFDVDVAAACVRFGMSVPGVVSTALNTSRPERVAENVAAVQAEIPSAFWRAMKSAGLLRADFAFLG